MNKKKIPIHSPYPNYPIRHTDFHQVDSRNWQFWQSERERKREGEKIHAQKKPKRRPNKRKVTLPNKWIIHPRIDFDKLPMVRPFTRFGSVDHDVVSISVGDPTPGYSSPFGCDRVGVTFRMSLYLPLYHNKPLTHTLEQRATKKKTTTTARSLLL